MLRVALAALLLATPALAEDSKEVSCHYQGEVAAAIQKARLKRVKKENVEATILASNPGWPEAYSKANPQLTEFIYSPSLKMRDLRKIDIGEAMETQCIEQWDNVQQIQKNMKNG